MDYANPPFYIFNQLLNFFCHITENDLSNVDTGNGDMGGSAGFPYEPMIKKVKEAYLACNATLAKRHVHWPNDNQIAAMTESKLWGKAINGEYSLQMDFAPQYRDSYFINCFSDSINDWAKQFDPSAGFTKELIIGGSIGGFFAIALCVYFLCSLKKSPRSSYETLPDDNHQNNMSSRISSLLQCCGCCFGRSNRNADPLHTLPHELPTIQTNGEIPTTTYYGGVV